MGIGVFSFFTGHEAPRWKHLKSCSTRYAHWRRLMRARWVAGSGPAMVRVVRGGRPLHRRCAAVPFPRYHGGGTGAVLALT
jgi:hypothetical protein